MVIDSCISQIPSPNASMITSMNSAELLPYQYTTVTETDVDSTEQ